MLLKNVPSKCKSEMLRFCETTGMRNEEEDEEEEEEEKGRGGGEG